MLIQILFICLSELVKCLKFKKAGHTGREGVPRLSSNGDGLLYCNKVFCCQKIVNTNFDRKINGGVFF